MFPINFAPKTPIVLISSTSSIKGFGEGSLTNSGRGAALQSAKSSASSGDTIYIYQSCTTTSSPIKSGVNLWLAPGVVISVTGAHLLDDSGGAITCSIGGFGTLLTDSSHTTINLTNTSSDAKIQAYKIDGGTAINQVAGSLSVQAHTINGIGQSIFWKAGNCYVDANRITTDGSQAIWGSVADSVTGQLWVKAKYINSTHQTVYFYSLSGNVSNAKIWIDTETLECDGLADLDSSFLVKILNVTFYLTAQKLVMSGVDVSGSNSSHLIFGGASHNYIKINKLSTNVVDATGQAVISNTNTAITFLDIDEFDDSSGGLHSIFLSVGNTSTCYFNGKRLYLSTASDGFSISGGNLYVNDVDIITQSSNKDLIRTGGTLNIAPSVRYDKTKTTGDIVRQREIISFQAVAPGTNLTVANGKAYFHVPPSLNGYNIVHAHALVITAGTTGTSDTQVSRIRGGSTVSVLSTQLKIDSTEVGTDTAATPPVINTSNDDILTNDILRIDVTAISTTPPQGLIITLEVQ